MNAPPAIWFERPLLPDLAEEVHRQVTVLGPPDAEDPYASLADAEGVLAGARTYDAEFFDHGPRLRVIARTGIGVDTVDIAEATRRGIAVCNTPDGPTISTAEHAVMLILAVAKNLKTSEAELRAGMGGLYRRHVALELDGATLGVVGFGRIAGRVAATMHAMGMHVIAHDPFLAGDIFPDWVEPQPNLDALLAAADVVSVHVPLTKATHGMFGTTTFAAMRPGAIFVNTARGGLVDHDALLATLASGHLFGAGLDVTDPEPLPTDHPLLARHDVIVTPHVASGTTAGKRRIFRTALEQAILVLRGERPPHLVNPEVWDRITAGGRS